MPIDPNSIVDPSSTTPANSEEADTSGIPEDVLALPIMAGLLNGAPPAVWAPIGTKGPEVATVLKHAGELNKAGFGFYRDEKGGLDVFYNSRFISPELVKKAAEKGKLKDVASPLEEVSAQINGSTGEPSGVVEPGASAATVASATGMPDTPVNTARLNNVQPGSPTSGPAPGAGRVLNNIIKPTI